MRANGNPSVVRFLSLGFVVEAGVMGKFGDLDKERLAYLYRKKRIDMKKKEVREIIEKVMFPFLQAEFGMSRVREGSNHIFAKLDVDVECASPVLLIIVTGSEFGYRVSPILSMSSKAVDRPGNVQSKK